MVLSILLIKFLLVMSRREGLGLNNWAVHSYKILVLPRRIGSLIKSKFREVINNKFWEVTKIIKEMEFNLKEIFQKIKVWWCMVLVIIKLPLNKINMEDIKGILSDSKLEVKFLLTMA